MGHLSQFSQLFELWMCFSILPVRFGLVQTGGRPYRALSGGPTPLQCVVAQAHPEYRRDDAFGRPLSRRPPMSSDYSAQAKTRTGPELRLRGTDKEVRRDTTTY